MADNENTILTEEESTRIINLSEASEMDAGMYFVTDSSSGTRKVPITKLIDSDLEKEYAAAPAKAVGDLKEELEHISGISDDVKVALLQIASKVAYIDDDGQDYYDALYNALYPPAELVSISAVYTQSGTVYDTDSLDSLKADLVVTALYDDQTTETVTSYTLSGTLEVGTSVITVSYGGKTTTFSVVVVSVSEIFIANTTTDWQSPLPALFKISYNVRNDRTFIGCDTGEHPIDLTAQSQGTIVTYPIPLRNITNIKVTSKASYSLTVLKYETDAWYVHYAGGWVASGTTLDVSAYTNGGYYYTVLIQAGGVTAENTTIEVTRG